MNSSRKRASKIVIKKWGRADHNEHINFIHKFPQRTFTIKTNKSKKQKSKMGTTVLKNKNRTNKRLRKRSRENFMATNTNSFQKNNFNFKTNSLFHIRRKLESKTVHFTIIFRQNNSSNKLFSCQTQMDIKTNKIKLLWADKLVIKTYKIKFLSLLKHQKHCQTYSTELKNYCYAFPNETIGKQGVLAERFEKTAKRKSSGYQTLVK